MLGLKTMADAISGLSSSASALASQTAATASLPVQTLNQKDFLNLLVAQLSSQDPLNPQKDTDFIAQMAQFSQLQSSQDVQTQIQSLRASQLLGQTVEVKQADSSVAKGVVTAVDSSAGDLKIIVGGQPFSLSDVMRVDQVTQTTRPPIKTQGTTGYSPS